MTEESLSEKAYRFIRRQLMGGLLIPGQRLVNRTLAAEIGVSVIPVREAIGRLASEGLVEQIPGSGAFVRKIDPNELDNLYVLRDALESCAAAEAAKFITDYQLEELESLVEKSEEVAEQIRETSKNHATKKQMNRWLDLEQNFHRLIILSAKNPLLAKVTEEYRAIGQVFDAHRENPQLLTQKVADATCEGKRKLLAALKNRNSEAAKTIVSTQIQRGRREVLTFLRSLS